MQPNKPAFEVCIDTVAGFSACEGLVDRIELCSALELGGLTPCPGLIAAAKASTVPSHVMIRPRAGDFTFDAADVEAMLATIDAVRAADLAGVVVGAAKGDALDLNTLKRLKTAAGDLDITLHRVIDLLPDPLTAMEQVIDLGFDRILTSGGAPKAIDGVSALRELKGAANGRIEIMAGSGVSVSNVAELARQTDIRSFHSSCSTSIQTPDHLQAFGFAKTQKVTDRDTVRDFRRILDTLPA